MRFREAYLWMGIPLIILCLWIAFFCVPLASQIEDKKRDRTQIEAQIARVEAELAQSNAQKADRAGNAPQNRSPETIPRLELFPDFMKRIASSVRKGGVTIDRLNGRLNHGTAGTGSALVYPITEMDFTGRFLDIARVLEQIQTVKAYRRIIRARLVAVENAYPDLKGNVEIEFKAWRD